jgi:hypothetical protein
VDERLAVTIAAIDAANAEDPHTLAVRGVDRPKALGEGELATEWVRRLVGTPTDELLLAARAHHLRRWTSPRSTYPDGRAGYLRWRRDLHEIHARDVAVIMADHGWPAASIDRVKDLVRKRGLGKVDDAELQALEDALCLVFIETQYDELAGRLDESKMDDVVAKTIKKMSPQGQALAATLR